MGLEPSKEQRAVLKETRAVLREITNGDARKRRRCAEDKALNHSAERHQEVMKPQFKNEKLPTTSMEQAADSNYLSHSADRALISRSVVSAVAEKSVRVHAKDSHSEEQVAVANQSDVATTPATTITWEKLCVCIAIGGEITYMRAK